VITSKPDAERVNDVTSVAVTASENDVVGPKKSNEEYVDRFDTDTMPLEGSMTKRPWLESTPRVHVTFIGSREVKFKAPRTNGARECAGTVRNCGDARTGGVGTEVKTIVTCALVNVAGEPDKYAWTVRLNVGVTR
jgi:hypothetical protein